VQTKKPVISAKVYLKNINRNVNMLCFLFLVMVFIPFLIHFHIYLSPLVEMDFCCDLKIKGYIKKLMM